jgi:hypothetical protein
MAFINQFPSPWDAVQGGQAIAAGLTRAEREGFETAKARKEMEALRQASAGMGSGNYFAGYDNVKGAERPQYLKDLYAQGDPEQAIKLEQFLAEPFKIQRGIETQGALEAQKRQAQLESQKQMFDYFSGKSPGGGGPGGEAEGDLSGMKRTFRMTPQGPVMEMENLSPVERANKLSEIEARKAGSTLATAKEQREAQNQAHEQVRQLNVAIAETQKAMQNRDMEPEEGQQRIAELSQMKAAAAAERDQLMRGGPSTQRAAPPMAAMRPPAPSMSLRPSADGLTYKERGEIASQRKKEQVTATNKEITDARSSALDIAKFRPKLREMLNLVTKNDIGHPGLQGVPYAENVLSATSRSNAQLKNLADQVSSMFAKPGQSQLMNTLAERLIVTSAVPSLSTDPEQNRVNAALLASNVEHVVNFAPFLEKWQKQHGTSDGSTEAWIDYAEHNPLYTYAKDKRGKVSVSQSKQVIDPDRWVSLRQSGGIRQIGEKMFLRQPDGAWKEK